MTNLSLAVNPNPNPFLKIALRVSILQGRPVGACYDVIRKSVGGPSVSIFVRAHPEAYLFLVHALMT